MSRRSAVPSYRLHKATGQAVVTLSDGCGNRKDVYLGRFGTPESRAEYARVLAEWEANSRRVVPGTSLTINELVAAYWKHATVYYRHVADGKPTKELADFRLSLRPLAYLFGTLPAAEFSPLKLKAVRGLMIDGYYHPEYGKQKALARGVVNQRIGRVKRVLKWAVENELLSGEVFHAVNAVRGLTRGRSEARETEPVKPVAEGVVDATLPHLPPVVQAMVRVQQLTGMRPGEVVQMRACDIDMAGAVWLYRPARHKTLHHGYVRVIAIGPKAQEVIRSYLKLDLQAFLFSPQEERDTRYHRLRLARKSKVQPSQCCRKKKNSKKLPGLCYSTTTYGAAIARGCDAAFPPPAPLARREGETKKGWLARLTPEQQRELREWQKAHRWHPHQLRHALATRLRREFGLDATRTVLGHHSPVVTEVYAERDLGIAKEVMARLG